MKKLLFVALQLVFFQLVINAQAPQAVCYQALAKDSQGNDIIESTISLRATILKGNPSGTVEWMEVFNPFTDQFGLFTVNIGEGIPQIGGAQTSFADIQWGIDNYWLRIEMDPNGGQNYILMGTNRILSVPYALYANGAGSAATADVAIYSDSSSVAGTADFADNAGTAQHANTADSATNADFADAAGTADFADNAGTAQHANTADSAVNAEFANTAGTANFADNAGTAQHATTSDTSYVAGSADFADNAGLAQNAVNSDTALIALVALNAFNNPGDHDLDSINEIQVPVLQGDTLFLQSPDGSLQGDGITVDASSENELQKLVLQGDSLMLQSPDGSLIGGDVFVDADTTNEIQMLEFDGLSISISGGNTIQIFDSKKPFAGPGSSFDLPQGILGQHITVAEGGYQVPPNKNFWVTAAGPTIKLKGYGPPPYVLHPTTPNMPVFKPSTNIEDCMCTGILIDTTQFIEPVIIDFINGSSSYNVPDGKILFVKSGLKNDEIGYLKINGEPMEFLRSNFTRGTRIITIPANTQVEPVPYNQFGDVDLILTGFLIDEDP